MSKINIDNYIKQTNLKSNIYLPLTEAIFNSIDAIEDNKKKNIEDGKIEVVFEREKENSLFEDKLKDSSKFSKIIIFDNGIGFNKENIEAFDTLCTEMKIKKGGKGFGRIMYKNHFHDISVESVFHDDKEECFKKVNFTFGNYNIVDKYKIERTNERNTWTKIYLNKIKKGNLDRNMTIISKRILEDLLPYFITEDYKTPEITLKEEDSQSIILNDLYKNNEYIINTKKTDFSLMNGDEEAKFLLSIFKIYSPHNQKSSICLVADKRKVNSRNLFEFIPEFEEEFFDEENQNKFIIKAYVTGKFLDDNVNLERLDFKFPRKKDSSDLIPLVTKEDIEKEVSNIIESEFIHEINIRRENKKRIVNDYIKKKPQYSDTFDEIKWNKLPMNPDEDAIENHLHEIGYRREKKVLAEIDEMVKNYNEKIWERAKDIYQSLDKAKKSVLAHYLSLRKAIIDVLKTSLERRSDEKYEPERSIHNIIFPTGKDSDNTSYDEHNLWILDERLSYTKYLASDKPIFPNSLDRPDIFIFDNEVAFRGDNEPSNPITIFEFKRPGRDDFTNESSKEDPYNQIRRYVQKIKYEKMKTISGRPIKIGDNTPFYGYIVADLNEKIKNWLESKNFKTLPDEEGYYIYHDRYNFYTEFISWDKLLKDAEMRHKIFFDKLGI